MKILATVSSALFLSLGFTTHAQTLRPDTLEDLKAEYEFQAQELAPYLKSYEAALQRRYECATRTLSNTYTICTLEDGALREAEVAAI